ncbi:MAG: hypothetical protein L0191_01340 [Acidobacteria bacterium]|nr:hypothetical protein [Acidobacteriota bacterium]
MEGEEQAMNPFEEMLRFWQGWTAASMDSMMRAMTLLAPGTPALAWTTVLREQVERAVQVALEAGKVQGLPDLTRLSEEVSLLRAQTEAMSASMATMQAAFQAQQQGWRTLETMVQQTAAAQQEAKRAVETWATQWEERVGAMTRGMEEWRGRWEEMLRQSVAVSQAGQKGLEELTKTMWDLAKKKKVTGST